MKRYVTPTQKERTAISNKVHYAIKTRRLIKQDYCEQCPSTDRVWAHHDDYNYPLRVRWLCWDCHMAFHERRRIRRGWTSKNPYTFITVSRETAIRLRVRAIEQDTTVTRLLTRLSNKL